MKKAILVVLAAVSVLSADTSIKVGTLNYSVTKNTDPITITPAARVFTDNSQYWATVRFPGYEHFYTVDRGFYPGWSSSYNPIADRILIN